jgi:hypothetical protein
MEAFGINRRIIFPFLSRHRHRACARRRGAGEAHATGLAAPRDRSPGDSQGVAIARQDAEVSVKPLFYGTGGAGFS